MNEKELKNYILHIISQLENKAQVENNKIELKREWYDFKDSEKLKIIVSEFLKDIVSIANTPGLEGYLIIGIDEKTGEIFDSPFKNSGLNDLSELYNLVIKSVDRPFDYVFHELYFSDKNKSISIFEIPPSVNKPHVIKYFLSKKKKEINNFIPIRKSTGIFPSNRSDLDFMYYDRKNIEPEYALEINAYNPHIAFNSFTAKPLEASLQLCFQNFGRKPIAITNSQLIIEPMPDYEIHDQLIFDLSKYNDPVLDKQASNIKHRYLIIPSNQIKMVHVEYNLNYNQADEEKKSLNHKLRTPDEFIFKVSCRDINNNAYSSPDIMHVK